MLLKNRPAPDSPELPGHFCHPLTPQPSTGDSQLTDRSSELHPRNGKFIQHMKSVSIKIKVKHHMIISIGIEKEFDKIQYLFVNKIHSKPGVERNFLNLTKVIYQNPTANIILYSGN